MEFADLICRSEQFSIDPIHGMVGTQSFTHPMWAAQQIYDGWSKEKFEYCASRAQDLSNTRGLLSLSIFAAGISQERYAEIGRRGLSKMDPAPHFFYERKIQGLAQHRKQKPQGN